MKAQKYLIQRPIRNAQCEAKDDCPASMTATTTADRCKANLICRLEDDEEHLEGPRVHELFNCMPLGRGGYTTS
jgi:hypothetical protein